MKEEIDYKQLRNALIESEELQSHGGWLIFLEAAILAAASFYHWDNALIALVVFVVSLALLAQKVIGTIVSIGFGGAIGYWIGLMAYNSSTRWDVGIAAGLVGFIFMFCLHQSHVKAFEKY